MTTQAKLIRVGDPWPEPYRGSCYHFNARREVWWQAPLVNARVQAIRGHEDLVDDLLAQRPEGGSFRITETGEVITKRELGDDDWEAIYVGDCLTPLEFDHVDVLGAGVNPLDLWPSFYDGARYSVKRGDLWWRNVAEDIWQRTEEALPTDLKRLFDRVKPSGGSLRITENGKVLTLIEPQPMPGHMRGQYEGLSTVQRRLVEIKARTTHRIPIFLGEHHGGFTLRDAERLTDPLAPGEEQAMVSFLKRYGDAVVEQASAPFDPDEDLEARLSRDDRDAEEEP